LTSETFNDIGGLNVPVHRLRKGIKRQKMLFVLCQAPYRFWIALSVFGFEGSKLDQSLRLVQLLPDPHQFGLDAVALSSYDFLRCSQFSKPLETYL
jgi:hypothetical protein